MKISKIHQLFSERLNQPDALKNPGKYLGPNYQDVLNFWIYLDTLSEKEREEMNDRYWALDYNVLDSAFVDAKNEAYEVVGRKIRHEAWWAVINIAKWSVFACTTLELFGLHKLLEQGKTLLALQYCTKP